MVQAALTLGFTLDELGAVLRERARGHAPCKKVRALAEQKLQAVELRMAELARVRFALIETLAEWDAKLARTAPGSCAGLLEALASRLHPLPLHRHRRKPRGPFS